MKLASLAALAGSGVLLFAGDVSAVIVVQSFAPVPTANVWSLSDMRGGGAASIQDLTGTGGNLENSQPLPTGAALLTTGLSSSDKAEVAFYGNLGNANTALTSGTFGYSFYKQEVVGGNVFAAPSLKIEITGPNHNQLTNDNYGQLIYEPNWNQGTGGSSVVPVNVWTDVSIGASTGTGATGAGGWWWSGGFGQTSGAGGPPIRSLSEWAGLFTTDPDFAGAIITGISVGVGSGNVSQVGYFDNVSINIPGGLNQTFDFQAVPEPTAALFGALLTTGLGVTVARRRRDEDA